MSPVAAEFLQIQVKAIYFQTIPCTISPHEHCLIVTMLYILQVISVLQDDINMKLSMHLKENLE